ncbi:hypothetical protein NDN08_002591 [Rhodosorus marinus]|uniref:SAP domain-containing protein n=1 Tax=Rhodosorus marinus TaxID=101924 RepID=A0AAV8UXN9_9RHOD|nr:hypothetical protein NDN08_002591 [Rhodosorus marinus]
MGDGVADKNGSNTEQSLEEPNENEDDESTPENKESSDDRGEDGPSDVIEGLSIRELRSRCKEKGLAIRGRKDELILRLSRISEQVPEGVEPSNREPNFSACDFARLVEVLSRIVSKLNVDKLLPSKRGKRDSTAPGPWEEQIPSTFNDGNFTPPPPAAFHKAHPEVHGRNVRYHRSGAVLRKKFNEIKARFGRAYSMWASKFKNDPSKFADFTAGDASLQYVFDRSHEGSPNVLNLMLSRMNIQHGVENPGSAGDTESKPPLESDGANGDSPPSPRKRTRRSAFEDDPAVGTENSLAALFDCLMSAMKIESMQLANKHIQEEIDWTRHMQRKLRAKIDSVFTELPRKTLSSRN